MVKRKIIMATAIFIFLMHVVDFYGTEFTKSLVISTKQLENSLTSGDVNYVAPYLANEFVLNDYEPAISKQLFSSLIPVLGVHKIDSIRLNQRSNDTIFVSTVLSADKGLFDVELTFIEKDEAAFILKIEFDFSLKVRLGDKNKKETEPREIDLKLYRKLSDDLHFTYYDSDLENVAIEIIQKQKKGIQIAEKLLGEDLTFPLGLLLLNDSIEEVSINQPVIPICISGANYDEDLQSAMYLNWVYFHEVVELYLVFNKGIKDQNTRWFRDGMADYIAHRVCSELNPKVDSVLIANRMQSYKRLNGKADLASWIGTGQLDNEYSGHHSGSGAYAGALCFFTDLVDHYGDQVISCFFDHLIKNNNPDSAMLIAELSEITGEDIQARLLKY